MLRKVVNRMGVPKVIEAAHRYKELEKKSKAYQEAEAKKPKKPKKETPRILKVEKTPQPEDNLPLEVVNIEELENLTASDLKNVDLSNITGHQVVERQLDLWGIKPDSLSYRILLDIPDSFDSDKDGKPSVDTIIDHAQKKFSKSKGTIINSLMMLIKKADFSQSKFIPVMASLPLKDITWQYLVSEIADFA